MVISFTSFAGQLSLNYGYSHLPTLTASALYYLLVVWSALLGVAVMGEGMDAFGACGAAVICLGGLLPSVNKARLRRAERRSNGGSERARRESAKVSVVYVRYLCQGSF